MTMIMNGKNLEVFGCDLIEVIIFAVAWNGLLKPCSYNSW
jgi:hypothetical protein